MKDNIIQFRKNTKELPKTAEEAEERILEVRTNYVRNVTNNILQGIVSDLNNYGFPIKLEGGHLRDLVMLAEILNSTMFRYINAEHFMHEVVDNVIELDGGDANISKMIQDMVNEGEEEE